MVVIGATVFEEVVVVVVPVVLGTEVVIVDVALIPVVTFCGVVVVVSAVDVV